MKFTIDIVLGSKFSRLVAVIALKEIASVYEYILTQLIYERKQILRVRGVGYTSITISLEHNNIYYYRQIKV